MIGARCLLVTFGLIIASSVVMAGEADIVKVKIHKTGDGTFSFDVTVRHGDTGWKHYANKWDVIGPNGNVLGTRVLHHPHETEQPFTRSLAGVRIASSVETVTVRGYDKRHGLGGAMISVRVPH